MQERQIKCPQCGRFTIYSLENKARPFCSARCKLIDLGQWADETYKVPVSPNQDLDPQAMDSSQDVDQFVAQNSTLHLSEDE